MSATQFGNHPLQSLFLQHFRHLSSVALACASKFFRYLPGCFSLRPLSGLMSADFADAAVTLDAFAPAWRRGFRFPTVLKDAQDDFPLGVELNIIFFFCLGDLRNSRVSVELHGSCGYSLHHLLASPWSPGPGHAYYRTATTVD